MRWFFTFNGVECRKPFAIDGVMHIHVNHGRTDSNIHKVTQIGGYCEGIAKEPFEWESMSVAAWERKLQMLILDETL